MYDIITVGSSTVDVFAKVDSELVKIKSIHHTEELIAYPSGTKILMKDIEFLTGGGGTNTAVAFSRLGLKTAYLGKIGNDENSEIIVNTLKKEKVEFVGAHGEGLSGYSIILDSLDNDRTILTYKGVNNTLGFEEINQAKIKTGWLYFSSMMERSYDALEKIASFAEKNKIKIAFNPSNYLAEKGRLYLQDLLSKTSILILNKEEACLLVGNLKEESLVLELMKLGPEIAIVTDGKNGSYTIHNNSVLHVIPHELKPIETTGAGDAFASSFVAGMIKKKPIEECLKMGALNAESVILQRGAKKGLMTAKQLSAELKKNPPRIIKKKLTF
jgi:ribokinase